MSAEPLPETTLAQANEPSLGVLADRVYAALVDRDYGTRISYEEFAAILCEDPQGRRGRTAILRAGRRLLVNDTKLLVNVRAVGYQIAKPSEHATESLRLQGAARRRLRRALAAVVHVALEAMDPADRARVLQEQVRVALKLGLDRRLSRAKALPSRPEIELPAGPRLVEMLSHKREIGG